MPISACTPVATDEALAAAPGTATAVPAASRQDRNGAWVLLLPAPLTGQRILCLALGDNDFRRPVSYWHDELDVVQISGVRGMAVHTHLESGRESRSSVLHWSLGQPLPFAQGTFSGVVVRLAGGGAVKHAALAHGRSLAVALLHEARRLLTDTGFLYLEIDNTWSVRNLGLLLRGKWGQLSIGTGRRSWREALRAGDFARPVFHPLLLERGQLAEVLPSSTLPLPRQPLGFVERLKTRLLGPLGARFFATAYGVMAGSGERRSLLEELLVTVAASPGVCSSGTSTPWFRAGRIISTPDKAFVECIPEAPGPQSLFLVVPLAADTIDRRRRELAAMRQLRASSLPITTLLPATACEADFRGRPVFIYSALPGRAIDVPVPQLPILTERAIDLLTEFNRSSQRITPLDPAAFATCIGSGLAGARGRYPEVCDGLTELQAGLERCLLNRAVPTVWVHGDFKIENLLFDMQSLRITGVIDWELASPVGLLAVDLLYLLAYNRVTRGDAPDVIDVIEEAVVPGSWMAHEQKLLDRYVRTFAIPEPYLAVASAVFVIHHIGQRFSYAGSVATRARLPAILKRLAGIIETVSLVGKPG